MTDAFEVTGEFAPAENLSVPANTVETTGETAELDAADAVETVEAPNGFVELGLNPALVQACKDLGYTQPTVVQSKAIPLAMGSAATKDQASKFIDLMVSSQTGSGKTAAFLLPVLHTLLSQIAQAEADERAEFERLTAEALAKGEPAPKRPKRKDPTNARNFKAPSPGALIVCPTRELAQQVAHDAIDLVQHCRGLRVANIVGGMPYQLQIAKLQNANLVVATPGRLLDLQRSMQIKLDQVQFLVVDEADRMLDLGFSDDLAEINQLTIARKQTMMFSATFAPRIQQLAARVMREPQRVTIDSPQEKHANIKQVLHWADNAQHKRKLLDHWLRDTNINQAIIFASTQVECDGLANDLQQDGFDAVALHGALSQGLRNRRLMALRQGQVQFLVATDVAARGIDVPTITHVFNFGLPMKAEDYTHRIGRTGRAGRDGLAITFAEMRDRRKIFDIEAYSRQPIKPEVIPGLEPQQRAPESRPSFGGRGRGDFQPRDRKFGGPREGGFGGGNRGFGGRPEGGGRGFGDNARDFSPAAREGFSYERKGGFNDRFAGQGAPRGDARPPRGDFQPRGDFHAPRGDFGAPRGDFGAPRGDFGARKPAFGKPTGFAKPGNGGKVFVPRDAKKRPARNTD
ncbi:DEAD/DEAH box helicase [Rhodoferax sp. TH121]|uniref:DEAD/DEAH box helicase n=1 Tax=Rhodoferax sp. TH121 TaxID=2022803 RepID=UPI000B968AC9|nr:DEAD/DEAH box helicase [Rhodoferax sp. TH121]OYQ39882.1 DEAD/DEAH box helicase [Rhodoferax sp. TH121]